MTTAVVRADARSLPLPDASVDLICTSPPYFGLRSYTDGGAHYDGQIGSEATPAEWLAAMVECTREMARVLKPEGSIFINIGDKYTAGHGGSSTMRNGGYGANLTKAVWENSEHDGSGSGYGAGHQATSPRVVLPGTRPKCLLGLPWRYALACTDQLGLILRAEIIWTKPNGLPESVTDRVRRAHEQVFHLVKQPRYYAAVDEIREPHTADTWRMSKHGGRPFQARDANIIRAGNGAYDGPNPLGKLPGSVWEIPSAPLTVPPALGIDHFAAFPPALVRPVILGWSPPGVCTECGQGRRPVSTAEAPSIQPWALAQCNGRSWHGDGTDPKRALGVAAGDRNRMITGYVCACPRPRAPTRPAVVVDPFGGTGTTALVASAYGRHGISFDLSADYCRLARWRVNDPGERARAMRVPKPPPVVDGQETLFEASGGRWLP